MYLINFLFILLLLSFVNSYGVVHKICTENYDRDACQQIARDQEIACAENIVSTVDCFINLDLGLPQFSIVKPEEALLAAPLVSEKVVVIGEVLAGHQPYQTAVVIRKPYDGGFGNLRGKRFCHPGFKHDELVTKLVLEEFESKIINLNSSYCNAEGNLTVVEKRIKALANFFGSSCRPGSWTESDDLDRELKSKYSSLCELCGADKCNINYQVPFNDTLTCLTNKGGDIAITTLNDAAIFFNISNNAENFQYLCPSGVVNNYTNPCTWTNQLNRLIVTESESATFMKNFIQNKLVSHISAFSTQSISEENYFAALDKILKLNKGDRINITETVALSAYVSARRSVPSRVNSSQCGVTVRWCTLNEQEQQKCKWLQQAALNSGLQPVIECIQSADADALSCLNDIKDDKADIAYTDVNYGYIALKKGLTVIAYPETNTRQLSSILIVVSAETSVDEIKSLKDLGGKRACFPEYGGKEWLAFIDTLRSKNILKDSCDYGRVFSDFVGDSCVPGAHSEDYGIENTDNSKLCAQCLPVNNTGTARYCNADNFNKYFGSDGALKCILEKSGDYAVITRNDVFTFVDDSSSFRVLSKNGSLSEITGLNVDEEAPLTIVTAGEVISKADSVKKDDIILLLRGIEMDFGQNLRKSFKVFESFNGTKDLLFPDSTPGLTFGETTIKYVENFKILLSNSEKCIVETKSSGSVSIVPIIFLILSFTCALMKL